MGVDGFVCFQNIYSYIATVPAVVLSPLFCNTRPI